jgi:hypothetical protein
MKDEALLDVEEHNTLLIKFPEIRDKPEHHTMKMEQSMECMLAKMDEIIEDMRAW